jgi:hypothetical protein
MSDPFYVNRGEINHNLSRLTTSLQKIHNSPHESQQQQGNHADVIQSTVKLIGELEHQLKDLADTFAIQSTNAKKLGLTMQELASRKDIVESHTKAFDSMREDFAYRVRGDAAANPNAVVTGLYSQRQSSKRRYEVERGNAAFEVPVDGKENPLRAIEPSRDSMHEMKQRLEDDDDDLVEVYQKKATSQTADAERALAKGANRRNPGVIGEWTARHFPLTKRRNRIIFFSFPVVLIVVVVVIILAVTLS